MSYLTIGDLRATIGERMLLGVSDRDGDGSADTTVVSMAISYAEAIIDGRLNSRYTVPLSTSQASTPSVIKMIAIDIAKHRLLYGMPQPDEYASSLKSAWDFERSDAMGQLSMYATGVMTIPGRTVTSAKPVMSTGLSGNNVEKVFTLTRSKVGGGAIDTGESGSMDVW